MNDQTGGVVFGDKRLGLIWGFRLNEGKAVPLEAPPATHDEGFVWLHFNLADRRCESWLANAAPLPESARELLLSKEDHQRAVVDEGFVACAIADFVHEFASDDALDTDLLRFAIGPSFVVTTRVHPLHSGDIIRRRIEQGEHPADAAEALDLIVSSVIEVISRIADDLGRTVEKIEDALLDTNREPSANEIAGIRRRAVQLDRQVNGLGGVLRRLERDQGLPEALGQTVADLVQLSGAVHGDLAAVQQQSRLLREELDLRTAQRTNQNLYFLSVMTALLLPATLVTGLFGMNTGGLPFASTPQGTFYATLIAIGSAGLALVILRLLGFFRR